MKARPLVLFFAKFPMPGTVKTRLCPPLSPTEAAELYEAFLLDLLDRFARHRSGYGIGVAYSPALSFEWFEARAGRDFVLLPQRGESLASRMENAFVDAASQGFGPVALIGTDLPTLPTSRVDQLITPLLQLESPAETKGGPATADMTLGIDRGGGYWGIGLRVPNPEIFRGLATSHGSVALVTMQRAAQLGLRVSMAGAWSDVDTLDDLLELVAELSDPSAAKLNPRTAGALARLGFLHRDN